MYEILLNKEYSSLLNLLELTGEIEGRIKFQKIVYILQSKGFPFSFKYKYHHFGPYSVDLQLGIEELVDNNLIKESGSDPYKYTLSEQIPPKGNDKPFLKNKDIIDLLNITDYRILELVSTIYYIKERGFKACDVIKKQLELLKPNLSKKINEAYDYYLELENDFPIRV